MRPETLLVLVMAMGIGGVVELAPGLGQRAAPLVADVATARGCRVMDGDTLRCGRERVRLLGIDAPELPGHCRPGRDCAPGDPFAATASLEEAATGELKIERVGVDCYGRMLAAVKGARGDLSLLAACSRSGGLPASVG